MSEANQESAQGGVLDTIANTPKFLGESWAELNKVTKPTRAETMQATVAVLVMIIIVSVYLAVADFIFRAMMDAILSS